MVNFLTWLRAFFADSDYALRMRIEHVRREIEVLRLKRNAAPAGTARLIANGRLISRQAFLIQLEHELADRRGEHVRVRHG